MDYIITKNEPLESCIVNVNIGVISNPYSLTEVVPVNQLKSAVEWLKEQIMEDNKKLAKDYELKMFGAETNHFIDMFFKNTMRFIDKAFPDLYPSGDIIAVKGH